MEKTPEQLVREQLDKGEPASWLWDEHGDTVVGTIIGGFVAPTKFREQCKVLTMVVDGEPRSVWLASDILEDKVMRQRPQVGDIIGIRRGEMKTSAGGSEYRDWQVQKYGAEGSALPWATQPAPALTPGQERLPGVEPEYEEAEVVDAGEPTAAW